MIWVVGDIHGMFDPLNTLVRLIKNDIYSADETEKAKIIFLGDYIDYGGSSKEVIDLLLKLKEEFEVIFLAGNHEDLLLQYVNESDLFKKYGNMWFRDSGSRETLMSLSPVKDIDRKTFKLRDKGHLKWSEFEVEDKYLDFFRTLKYSHVEHISSEYESFKLVFTHSGINPENDVEKQLAIKSYDDFHSYLKENNEWIENSILWRRQMLDEPLGEYIFIHGHTPTVGIDRICHEMGNYNIESGKPFFNFGEKEAYVAKNGDYYYFSDVNKEDLISINIDTGAILGKYLSAIKISYNFIEDRKIKVLQVPTSGSRRSGDYKIQSYNIKVPYAKGRHKIVWR